MFSDWKMWRSHMKLGMHVRPKCTKVLKDTRRTKTRRKAIRHKGRKGTYSKQTLILNNFLFAPRVLNILHVNTPVMKQVQCKI